ncbi:MAG: hypothetical protein K2L22_01920 [Muribaculaceae bacterium]|nr:hypothetical protein [Muribaculaceae bacterium]
MHYELCINKTSIDPDGAGMTASGALCSPRQRWRGTFPRSFFIVTITLVDNDDNAENDDNDETKYLHIQRLASGVPSDTGCEPFLLNRIYTE